MELRFDQPSDCTLNSATIQLTLDEDDPGLELYRANDSQAPASKCPVLITDYYGPGQIVGIPKRVLVREKLKIEPSINVAGNGGSLGGMKTEKQFVHESRWTFRSHTVPDNGPLEQIGAHRILKWEMTENDIEKWPIHSNKVYTAFAYEHSGQPFLMKVEISGKLKQRTDRLKVNIGNTLKKFGPRARKRADISSTLVGAYSGPRRPLDELAKGLASAMDMANSLSPPHVVPDTQTASFQQVTLESTPAMDAAAEHVSNTANQAFIEDGTYGASLTLNGRTSNILDEIGVSASRERTVPTLENLARAGIRFKPLIRKDPALTKTLSEVSVDSSAPTLVADQYQQTEMESRSVTKGESSMDRLPLKVDQDAMNRLLDVAFFRVLMQLALKILNFFDRDQGSTTRRSE